MSRSYLLALLLLLTLALACGFSTPLAAPPSTSPAPLAPASASTPAPLAGTPVSLDATLSGAEFAPFVVRDTPSLPLALPLVEDISELGNPQALANLNREQQQTLAAVGFVVIPAEMGEMETLYQQAATSGSPLYVTPDLVLHHVDAAIDRAWRATTRDFLADDLRVLSAEMATVALAQWQKSGSRPAWENLAFFSVGSRLLDREFEVAAPVQEVVADELTLIAEGGVYLSPLFGEPHDYDQYQASHAPDVDGELARFERATTWFARPFSFSPDNPERLRANARRALLMARALESTRNWPRWNRLFRPMRYFRGDAQSLSLEEVAQAAVAIYGALPVAEPDEVDDLAVTLQALSVQGTLDPTLESSFRFLPARLSPGESVFRALVFNRVGEYLGERPLPETATQTAVGPVRALPHPLDLPYAFGSSLAGGWLEASGESRYRGYEEQIEQLQSHLESLDEGGWAAALPGARLFALQPLLSTPAADAHAWQALQLNSWHGAWVESREPAAFAPRQPLPSSAASTPAYVVPRPLVYARLAALVRQTASGLAGRGLETEESARLELIARLLDVLQQISIKELVGEPLTADEALLAREVPSRLAALTAFPDENGEMWQPLLPSITLVYADPQSGLTVQAAVGEAWPIYALIPAADGSLLAKGAVYSSYALWHEHSAGAPPGVWLEMENRPAPAAWTELFNRPGRE